MALFFIPTPGIPSLSTPTVTRTRNPKLGICSGVKHLDREEELGLRLGMRRHQYTVRWLYLPSIKTEIDVDEEDSKKDYYVNTGYAIRTLREEFPHLFYTQLSFDIYRDDIVFRDPLNTFHGIDSYKTIFWALRFHGKMFFRVLWVDIISVWQPTENMIMVRWTVQGIPRIPWQSHGRFDGTSEYKLDKNGKIYEHRVHNIALNGPQKFQVLAVEQLIQSIGCPSTPKPTCFQLSSSPRPNMGPFMQLSAVKRYLASMLTRNQKSEAE